MFFCELRSLRDHPSSLPSLWSYDDLRPEHAHELSPFDAEGFGHGDNAGITALGANHGDGYYHRIVGGGVGGGGGGGEGEWTTS